MPVSVVDLDLVFFQEPNRREVVPLISMAAILSIADQQPSSWIGPAWEDSWANCCSMSFANFLRTAQMHEWALGE